MIRISLQRAAELVDELAKGRTLTDRQRYIAARHLQDRVAGHDPLPADRRRYAEDFDAWATVARVRAEVAPLIERKEAHATRHAI